MNEKMIFEIGDVIGVRRTFDKGIRKMTAKEIIDSYEYKMFKQSHPALCESAERDDMLEVEK